MWYWSYSFIIACGGVVLGHSSQFRNCTLYDATGTVVCLDSVCLEQLKQGVVEF